MDSKHEVLDINSGVAMYNSSEWDTWRTSFRECIKLCKSNDPRLEAWKAIGNGLYGDISVKGANDAIEYYNSVQGDMTELMKTYDWAWLKTYFQAKNA
jgi:hypothetical protein